jgi:hypothetical protein
MKSLAWMGLVVLFSPVAVFSAVQQGPRSPRSPTIVPGCSETACVVAGIKNVAFGNATFEAAPDGLIVNGIGSSILDGAKQVDLDEHDSRYMVTTLATPNFSLSISGTRAEIDQIGFADSASGRLISTNIIENYDGDNVQVMMTCGFFVEGYTVSVYQDGALVAERPFHLFPPVIRYPKEDLLAMACGLEDDGNLYTTMRFGSSIPIEIQTAEGFIGPFEGSCVRFQAFNPAVELGLQESIVNRFANTGPVKVVGLYAGPLVIPDTLCP